MKIDYYTEFECPLCGSILKFCSDLYADQVKGAYCIGDLAAHYVEEKTMRELLNNMLKEEKMIKYSLHLYHPVWEMEIRNK